MDAEWTLEQMVNALGYVNIKSRVCPLQLDGVQSPLVVLQGKEDAKAFGKTPSGCSQTHSTFSS